jgi:tetratricopeptide (TPR) repeat protein
MSRNSRRSGFFGGFRRWWRKRQHGRDSLRSRRNSSLAAFFSFPTKLRKWFRYTTLRFFRFQSRAATVVGAESKGASRKLRWVHFLNPLHWVTWPAGFALSYLLSRPYLNLGPALLAIAVIISVLGLLAQQQYQGGRASRVQLYQRLLSDAAQTKDWPRALVSCKTLIDLQPNDLRFQFERAQIEKELGNTQVADELMFRLATQKKYGLAALWLTEQKFNLAEIKSWKEDQHQLFRGLMSAAIDGSTGPVLDGAKYKLASYLMMMNANAEALRFLSEIIPRNPQLALTGCELARSVNDQIRLQTLLPIALSYHRAELGRTPDNVDQRINLGRALVLDDDIDEAINVLSDGQRLTPNEKIQNSIAEALIFKGDKIARNRQSPNSLAQRVQVVHQALKLAPNNPLVVEALVDLLLQCHKNESQESLILKEAALQGLDPESVHFIRGTIALIDNNTAEAKIHLELASKSGVPMPGVLNNLAVAIATDEKGDLNQALNLSNEACSQMQHPYLFETRGQILFKMGRYQECILDLEKGLAAQELAKAIYPSLVIAYEKTGNPKLSEEYATRLAEMTAAKPETETEKSSEKPSEKPTAEK